LSSYKELFSELVVSSVERLDTDLLDKDLIGIKLVTGGSITVLIFLKKLILKIW